MKASASKPRSIFKDRALVEKVLNQRRTEVFRRRLGHYIPAAEEHEQGDGSGLDQKPPGQLPG